MFLLLIKFYNLNILFSDGIKRAYGDQNFCSEWMPTIQYDPIVDALPVPFITQHTYWYFCVFPFALKLKNQLKIILSFVILDNPLKENIINISTNR